MTPLAKIAALRALCEPLSQRIRNDDGESCCICGDSYQVDQGKESTGFCHDCASTTLDQLAASLPALLAVAEAAALAREDMRLNRDTIMADDYVEAIDTALAQLAKEAQ